MRFLLVLALSTVCVAQTQGNINQVIEDFSDSAIGATAGTVVMGENVNTNDKLIAVIHGAAPLGSFTPTDTLGNTYTCTSAVTDPPPTSTAATLYLCYTTSGSAGANTVTACPANSCRLDVMHGVNLGAVDGSAVAVTNSVSGLSSFTNSITTTVNGDIIITCLVAAGGSSYIRGDYLTGPADGSSGVACVQTRTGAFGTYNITMDANSPAAFGGWPTQAAISIAFKPSTIMLTDTALPQAATNIAYSAQLHGVGGTAALTCSVFSGTLPTGLSLGGTGNCVISGTPTGTTQTVGFHVTDGTVTSATDTLTLTVGAAFDTPTVRSSNNANDTGQTTFNVQCGDVIVVIKRGTDTHNTEGWKQQCNGTNNYVKDSYGSPVQAYFGPWGASMPYALDACIIGPVLVSGPDTISTLNNQSASTNIQTSPYYVVRGVQGVVDSGAVTNIMTSTNTSTVSANYTTLVPNTLLLGAISGQGDTPIDPVGTPSMAAPFSVDLSGGDATGHTTYGHYLSATATSVTLTNNVTGQGTTDNAWNSMIIPLRPALTPVAGCASPVPGEKIRRQVW